MKPSKIAVQVATKFLKAQVEDPIHVPRLLLKSIEEVQSSLHGATRRTMPPVDASVEEQKSFARIVRAAKAMLEQSEVIRLDLDDWIVDYEDARITRA